MGFFSFVSKAWDGIKSLPSKAWDTVKNGASDAWSTVKHAAGSVTNLVKSGAKAVVKATPIVYHKAEDVAKTLYNDAKDLVHGGHWRHCSDIWLDQVLDNSVIITFF
jgi:phage-related protein